MGPDGISAKLQKLTCANFVHFLKLILQQSCYTGCTRENWKLAFVIPICKSGLKSAKCFRPISLTLNSCIHAKYFSIFCLHTWFATCENNLICDNLHNFLANSSCNNIWVGDWPCPFSELLCYTEAIVVDLSDVFDRVHATDERLKSVIFI